MRNRLIHLFFLALVTYLMAACTVLQPVGTPDELASIQNQRAASAEAALLELEDIDTLIKLDNIWLGEQIETELKSLLVFSEQYEFRSIDISFYNQYIALDAIVNIKDQDDNKISASISGDILLYFSGSRLEWLPRFTRLEISSRDFIFEDGSYAEPIPELTRHTLQRLNSDFTASFVGLQSNSIPLNATPLGEVQVGASLPGFALSPASHTQALRGMFMVAGSAMLIAPLTTSIALDMTFIPDLSSCPADVTVSRAEFASGIESREPVGIASNMNNASDIRYFYSEISGAKRPLTIIHYWFADGLPIAVNELGVGPSERWRTWSAKGETQQSADHWEVLVVEKDSGCILHSKSIRTLESQTPVINVDPTHPRQAFKALKDEFNIRTAAFSISGEEPVIALIEVRRPFLREVLQASLADLHIDAEFDGTVLSALNYSATLQPFDTEDIICEHRSCPPVPACQTNLSQCKRLRDTRNCSSCLFRNPLNNRCVSEAVDPLCEASRKRQNAKYDADRGTCIANAETSKLECDRLNAQAVRSCQIEAGFEDSACESIRSSMSPGNQSAPLAHVKAQTNTNGKLWANFSNFQIEDDLSRIKLDMALKFDLLSEGKLNFIPSETTHPLAKCIAAWSGPFKNRSVTATEINRLLGNLEQENSMLTADWSGFGFTINTNPSPLESVFVGNPQLLANCRIGLTVSKVEQAITGNDAEFFSGSVELEVQPLPTIIHLAPATIGSGDTVYSAEAQLSAQHLRFDIDG